MDYFDASIEVSEVSEVSEISEISIEGIDVSKGMESARGRIKFYKMLLNTYHGDGAETCANIETSLKNRDLILYTTYVHGLKSASDVVGAEKISDASKLLEDAGNRGDWDYIEKHNSDFLAEYKKLLENINAAL